MAAIFLLIGAITLSYAFLEYAKYRGKHQAAYKRFIDLEFDDSYDPEKYAAPDKKELEPLQLPVGVGTFLVVAGAFAFALGSGKSK